MIMLASNLIAQTELTINQKSVANKFGEKNLIEYKLKLADGKLSNFVKEFDYDVPFPSVNIISDKYLIFANSLDASIELLNFNGISLKKIYLSEKKVEYERSVFIYVFKNKFVAVLSEPTENFHHIFLFDDSLNLLSETKTDGLINGVFYANQSIFLSTLKFDAEQFQKFIDVTDLNLNTKFQLQGNFSRVDFSEDMNRVLLYDNKSAILFDLTSLNVISQFISNNYIIAGKLFSGKLIILESDKMEYENMHWKYFTPVISEISIDSKQVKTFKPKTPTFVNYKWINENSILLDEIDFTLE